MTFAQAACDLLREWNEMSIEIAAALREEAKTAQAVGERLTKSQDKAE
jgi:hypothetical protein